MRAALISLAAGGAIALWLTGFGWTAFALAVVLIGLALYFVIQEEGDR